MSLIRCNKIKKSMDRILSEFGWDDYVYTFSQNKDWTDPESVFIREASRNMQHFLKKYKTSGLQCNRYKFAALKSDQPKMYRFEHLENSSSTKEKILAKLIHRYDWESVLSFPVYGYGGALGIVGLYSKQVTQSDECIEATIIHLSPRMLQFNAWSRELIGKSDTSICSLSSREMECMQLVADGRTSSVIGDILNISKRTVDFHVHNATEKLGCTSRSQAAWRLSLLPSTRT